MLTFFTKNLNEKSYCLIIVRFIYYNTEKKESDNQNVSFNKKLLDTEYSDIENKLTSSGL